MCYSIIIRKQELPVTIREKRTSISQFAAALRQRSPQEKRDLLVADTLDSLCRHCDLYDAARVSNNPFHPELLRTIAAADLSSEALFSLFECLAVLVHLRKLAHPAIPLDEAEEELLFQFEHSGEWLPDDLTWSRTGTGTHRPPSSTTSPLPASVRTILRVVFLLQRRLFRPLHGIKKGPLKRAFLCMVSAVATGHGQ